MRRSEEEHLRVMRIVDLLPFGDREDGLMELVALAMSCMNMATVTDLRRELSLRLPLVTLRLVDKAVALRISQGPLTLANLEFRYGHSPN
jgi:hypothetical protein